MHNLKANFDKIFPIVKQITNSLIYKESNVGRPPKFCDTSIIALNLTAQSIGIDSENYLFAKLQSEYRTDFPNLITRSKYNIRVRSLRYVIEQVRHGLCQQMDNQEQIFSVDSMPVEICKIARSSRVKICKNNSDGMPTKGYCASQRVYYFGYKLHAVVGMNGIINMYDITPANVHDIHYLSDVRGKLRDCMIIADKAYDSAPLQTSLFEENKIFLHSPKRDYGNLNSSYPFKLKLLRKRVETTFSQLCDQFMIRRNYAKSFDGFASRIISKITAFTLLQFINAKINSRPINQIKHALA